MIVCEQTTVDNKVLDHRYSDKNLKIRKIGSGETYDDAFDVHGANVKYEETELPRATPREFATTYTAEQLAEMTTAELKAICTELGISTDMDAENMITLIMDKQKGEIE